MPSFARLRYSPTINLPTHPLTHPPPLQTSKKAKKATKKSKKVEARGFEPTFLISRVERCTAGPKGYQLLTRPGKPTFNSRRSPSLASAPRLSSGTPRVAVRRGCGTAARPPMVGWRSGAASAETDSALKIQSDIITTNTTQRY